MHLMQPGELNLITDVAGLQVGNAVDEHALTGVTVIKCDKRMTAAVDVRGGGPGTREIDVMSPENLVDKIDALVLTGGSVFGLAAADAVTTELARQNTGLRLSEASLPVPIVPAAVLHDLSNGGDKNWGDMPPYNSLGHEALSTATRQFSLGPSGAGKGARAGTVAGGLGSASIDLGDGIIVGALVAVNCVGSALLPDGITFYAWPYELNGEFGNHPPPPKFDLSDPFPAMGRLTAEDRLKPGANTTLAAIATSLELTRPELKRVAMMAHDGMARAIRPAHAPFDGDVVFALSGATTHLPEQEDEMARHRAVARIGAAAGDCLARAIARGVFESQS